MQSVASCQGGRPPLIAVVPPGRSINEVVAELADPGEGR
jgi:hypothetical protein